MEPGSDVNKVESIFLEEKNVVVFVTCISKEGGGSNLM